MFKRCLTVFGLAILAVSSFMVCSKKASVDFDILITNGKLIDGTGNPWFSGDIGISGDTIAEVGHLKAKRLRRLSMSTDSSSRRALSIFTLTAIEG